MEDNVNLVSVEIELVQDVDQYEKLQRAWEFIAQDSIECSLYGQPWFLAKWWRYFSAEGNRPFVMKRGMNIAGESCSLDSLYVVVAKNQKQVVGILPFMLLSVKPRGQKGVKRVLSFLGDFIFNPCPAIHVQKGFEYLVAEAAAKFIGEKNNWDACLFLSLRSDFVSLDYLCEFMSKDPRATYLKEPLHEVLFSRSWSREQVCRSIRALAEKLNDGERRLINFCENLEKLSQIEFTEKCIGEITPQIENLLRGIVDKKPGADFWISRIKEEIAQIIPYFYQVVALPKSLVEFQAGLSYKKRYELKGALKDAQRNGYQISFTEEISEDDFEIFFRIHGARFPQSVHFNQFTLTYYKDLLVELAKRGAVYWSIVRNKKNEPVFFGLYYHDQFMNSMDFIVPGSARTDINFGDLCVYLAIEKGINLGCKYFSFRMGNEKYKERFNPQKLLLSAASISRSKENDFNALLPKHLMVFQKN